MFVTKMGYPAKAWVRARSARQIMRLLLVASYLLVCSIAGYSGPPTAAEKGARTKPTVELGFVDDGSTGTRCVPTDADSNVVVWPISGTSSPDPVLSPYGPRVLNGTYDFHAGIDIPPIIPGQTLVRAAMDGTVVRKHLEEERTPTCRFGNWVMLRHADGCNNVRRYTTYLHLSDFRVNLGDRVSAGQAIGTMGMTGCGINTEHLHFEYYENLNNVCGVFLEQSRNPFGLPLPIEDQSEYSVRLGRQKDQRRIILRGEIPAGRLDIVEYKVMSSTGMPATYRVDLNEKCAIAGRPCTKCCDKAFGPNGNGIQLMPKQFTGDQNYVLCIGIDNVDVSSTYRILLRRAGGGDLDLGRFSPDDPPGDVADCIPSEAPGCSSIGVCRSCVDRE